MTTDVTLAATLLGLAMIGGIWIDLNRRHRRLERRLNANAATVRILAEDPPVEPEAH